MRTWSNVRRLSKRNLSHFLTSYIMKNKSARSSGDILTGLTKELEHFVYRKASLYA